MESKFVYANEMGVIRKEVVASDIDYLTQKSFDVSADICQSETFRLPQNLGTAQHGTVYALVSLKSSGYKVIPSGSVIHKVIVSRAGTRVLDDFTCSLGYICHDVLSDDDKVALSKRIVGDGTNLDGPIRLHSALLRSHKQIVFPEHLVAAENEIMEPIANAALDEDGPAAEHLTVLSGQVHVGERLPLIPAFTLHSGSVQRGDLLVTVVYSTPSC